VGPAVLASIVSTFRRSQSGHSVSRSTTRRDPSPSGTGQGAAPRVPRRFSDTLLSPGLATDWSTNRTLLLTPVEEGELVEVDGLVAGSAAAGPAAQDGLQEQQRLRQRQAGRGAFGSSRSGRCGRAASSRRAWASLRRGRAPTPASDRVGRRWAAARCRRCAPPRRRSSPDRRR
jgi:hypothetical protein